MTAVVAEAIEQYIVRQDLAPIADLIAASERRFGVCPAQSCLSPVAPRP
jgi:hypothetical protein